MVTNEHDDVADGELVQPVADPIRFAFAAAIGAVLTALPDGPARTLAVDEIAAAHQRVVAALMTYRKTLN